ncbi:hypothetical protein B0H16DRAFT_1746379 [Mycena metata]|uniref:BHLH domain-containing protein n=1 Tax=Mycena metata TaxID=1033252 RepID=A0AAD7GYK2_9AGAR|nr:hypothetical protein B0H16DRAFT_1746379 [Mycena metata]
MSTLMNNDLGLDPSDPLNFLLHNPPSTTCTKQMTTRAPALASPQTGIHSAAPSPLPSSGSESGSSIGSFSPPPSMCAAPVDTGYFASTDDPATELANRVRKNAGVVLAVQIGATRNTTRLPPQPRLPPLPRPPATPVQTATQSRPKTSHTTIERRYRTNLNARIQSLRQAIPALRVVDRTAAIKAGEPYPVARLGPARPHRRTRGFVDGVKVARKCSKANVLGKAVEYIRVLKNREKRLMRELEGPMTLLRGFVEGTELLGSGSDKKMCGRPTKVVPLHASDCVHKPAVRNVRVVSAGRRGIAPSPSLSFPPSFPMLSPRSPCSPHVPHALPSFPTLLFPSDPPPSRHCRTPTPSSRALHPGCICRMHTLRAALVPTSLVFTLTLPPPYYPPCSPPSSRVQLAIGSDAAHAHTHVCVCACRVPALVPFSFFSTLSPVPRCTRARRRVECRLHQIRLGDGTAAHAHAVWVRGESLCAPLQVLLARGDARAEFASTHCANARPLCCIPSPGPLSFLSPSPSLPFLSPYLPHVRYVRSSE